MKKLIQLLIFLVAASQVHAGVRVSGNVKKPGEYDIKENLNLFEALKLAGGVSAFGHSVFVYRDTDEAGWLYLFVGHTRGSKLARDFKVKDGDVVYITGKPVTKIEVPNFIANTIKAKNKPCYKTVYSVYKEIKKES